MLTEIEKRVIERISNQIIDDCLNDNPENAKVALCITDRSKGIEYIANAIQNLPKDHPTKKELPKLSEMARDIKEDTIKWAVLRGIM